MCRVFVAGGFTRTFDGTSAGAARVFASERPLPLKAARRSLAGRLLRPYGLRRRTGAARECPAAEPQSAESRGHTAPATTQRYAHLVASDMSVFERLPRHRRDAEGLGSFAFLYHGTVASRAEALFSAFRLVTMV
jgi:hypothetical protein